MSYDDNALTGPLHTRLTRETLDWLDTQVDESGKSYTQFLEEALAVYRGYLGCEMKPILDEPVQSELNYRAGWNALYHRLGQHVNGDA